MKTETLFDVASLGLRAAEAALRRKRPITDKLDSRADKLVRRALPVAEKALARVVPLAAPAIKKRQAKRRRSRAAFAGTAILGAAVAGAAAYIVVKEQQRVRQRYAP